MVWWNREAFPMLTRFLYRNNTARHRYTAKQPSQPARKGCQHCTDTMKLCSDVSSPLLTTAVHTLYHRTSVSQLSNQPLHSEKQKFRKIYKSYTSKFETLLQRRNDMSDAKNRSWQLRLLLHTDPDHFQTPNFAPGKSASRIMKNGSLMAPTALQKRWCRSSNKAKRPVAVFRVTEW